MDRVGKTIAGRISLAVLAIHLFVLPALYFAVVFLVKQSNEELFLNNVRTHARFIADSLERLQNIDTNTSVVDILDSIVLSSDGVYAELKRDSQIWVSSLVNKEVGAEYSEDFAFGEHGDAVYFISVPVVTDGLAYSLRIGFDESPVIDANQRAYFRGAVILIVYLIVVLVLVSFIGRRVMRPVKALRKSSRDISSGNLAGQLTVDTDLVEFVDLSRDLESMRTHLIEHLFGINRQLQEEIEISDRTESERQQLEHQLRHRQGLETVGTLAGGIAHELNNILVPILLYTEMAMDGLPESDPVRNDLNRVLRASNRARRIVTQMLTFGRQMTAVELRPVDVGEVLKESLDLVQESLPPNAEIQIDIEDQCPLVFGNSLLVGQIVINLCTNACQSLKKGVGLIEVSLKKEMVSAAMARSDARLSQGEFVKLSVVDSGEGMDHETMARIIEPFFTTRDVGDGTGLGLSVVHGIVTNMGGNITVTSSPDEGARFDIYFPPYQGQTMLAKIR
jgi:signal transduction histidine kinase